jgi:hypothetical protein
MPTRRKFLKHVRSWPRLCENGLESMPGRAAEANFLWKFLRYPFALI